MFVQVFPGTQRGGRHFWETVDEKCEAIDSLPSWHNHTHGWDFAASWVKPHRQGCACTEVAYVSVLGSAGKPPDNPPPKYALTRELHSHLVG